MKTILIVCLFSVLALAQDQVSEVTLGDVLRFTHPGIEWTLEEPAPPEEPSITLWDSTDPQPTIAALESIRDNPPTGLQVFVDAGAQLATDPPATEAAVRAYVTAQCAARGCDAAVVISRLFPDPAVPPR